MISSSESIRIAIMGGSKSGKSTFIMKMSNSDSGVCNIGVHFNQKLNKQFYVEYLEVPDLKSEESVKLLLNTCAGVVVVIEACDMNHYTVNQYTNVINSIHKISNSVKSYSESQSNVIKEIPIMIIGSKIDVYEKIPSNFSKYALIHNVEEISVNLVDNTSFSNNLSLFHAFIDKVIDAVPQLDKSPLDFMNSNMKRSISKNKLEVHSSMGSLRSIPDVE